MLNSSALFSSRDSQRPHRCRRLRRFILSAVFFACATQIMPSPRAWAASGEPFSEPTAERRPHFEKKKIKIGAHIVTVEIADNDEKREYGLMFVKSLPANQGMLFIFNDPERLNFWMKNTIIPLSIGYFDSNRILLNIREMKPQVMGEREPKTYASDGAALYALEMPKNWFLDHRLGTGSAFTFVGKP